MYNPQGREKAVVEGTPDEKTGPSFRPPGWHLAIKCIWPSGILSLQLLTGIDRQTTNLAVNNAY